MPFDSASASPPSARVYLRPGVHDVTIYDARESSAGGSYRLVYRVRDDSGAVAKLELDLDGPYSWRAAELCSALGIAGWTDPAELIGRRVRIETRASPTRPQYLRAETFCPLDTRAIVG